jgi:hypothetical protein
MRIVGTPLQALRTEAVRPSGIDAIDEQLTDIIG